MYRSVDGDEIPDYSNDCHHIPSNTKYLTLVMGNVVDHFRPIPGKTYCEMLQSHNLHQWSRDTSNWVTPTFDPRLRNHRGGSGYGYPMIWQDTRGYVSFWGSTESSAHTGGCCHRHVWYHENGTMQTDNIGWRKPFRLYYATGIPSMLVLNSLFMNHLITISLKNTM